MVALWFFGQPAKAPVPKKRKEIRFCKFCGRLIRSRSMQGVRFWVNSRDEDHCKANPMTLRPFGGEHEPKGDQ